MPKAPEQQARAQIDVQLRECGWNVQDLKDADFSASRGIALREVRLKTGPCDYLLLVDKQLIAAACAPFDKPALRDTLENLKRETEQAMDIFTLDEVTSQGFDAAAKAKAAGLVQSFRDWLASHQAEIDALQILYSRPYRQRLTEAMLKELEKKLREKNATWTEDRLWDAYAVTTPHKVRGRSQAGRFSDLVALVRFALEQQPVLTPFADSVQERYEQWLKRKEASGAIFNSEQRAWLGLIRDHIATSLSIEPDDFEYAPFTHRGGLGKAHQLFGAELPQLLDESNEALAACASATSSRS